MSKAKYVKEVTVIDPDSGNEVEVTIFKHDRGGMFALDSSYIEQVLPYDGKCFIPDPFHSYNEVNEFKDITGVELIGF